MTQDTCSIPACECPSKARGMCSKHYQSWWEKGGKSQTHRYVRTTGSCTVDDCGEPHEARGYCRQHYSLWRRTGDPLGKRCLSCGVPLVHVLGDRYGRARYCSDVCKPRCSVERCDGSIRKFDMCAGHYAQVRTNGVATPWTRKWNPAGGMCPVCGRPAGSEFRSRIHCSPRCQQQTRLHGIREKSRPCALCGTTIDLFERSDAGRIIDYRTKLCKVCRRRKKFKTSARAIAKRDGLNCGICGGVVDLDLTRAESVFCASIDHIVPRAHGGTDDPTNLQLAHFWCNAVKSDRESFTI